MFTFTPTTESEKVPWLSPHMPGLCNSASISSERVPVAERDHLHQHVNTYRRQNTRQRAGLQFQLVKQSATHPTPAGGLTGMEPTQRDPEQAMGGVKCGPTTLPGLRVSMETCLGVIQPLNHLTLLFRITRKCNFCTNYLLNFLIWYQTLSESS